MGYGQKKDYRAATFRLPPRMLSVLDQYCDRHGLVKGFVVESALREYFGRRGVGGYNDSEKR